MGLDKRTLLLAGGGIMVVTCILYIVSNALTSWGTASGSGATADYGLWRACLNVAGFEQCGNLDCTGAVDSVCGKMMTARAFITLACICSALAAGILLFCLVQGDNVPPNLLRLAKFLPSISFLAGLIGVAAGIAFIKDDVLSLDLGGAAILAIITVILNLVGAVLSGLLPL